MDGFYGQMVHLWSNEPLGAKPPPGATRYPASGCYRWPNVSSLRRRSIASEKGTSSLALNWTDLPSR
jgi:hypothetical protein